MSICDTTLASPLQSKVLHFRSSHNVTKHFSLDVVLSLFLWNVILLEGRFIINRKNYLNYKCKYKVRIKSVKAIVHLTNWKNFLIFFLSLIPLGMSKSGQLRWMAIWILWVSTPAIADDDMMDRCMHPDKHVFKWNSIQTAITILRELHLKKGLLSKFKSYGLLIIYLFIFYDNCKKK